MALKYLLDTNILSSLLSTKYDKTLQRRLRQHADEIATAAPVWFELWYGCLSLPTSARRQRLERDLLTLLDSRMPVLPYDESAAATHASLAAELKQRGKPAPYVDGQIAGIALSQQLIVVTDNVRDFRRFPGLPVENWLRG